MYAITLIVLVGAGVRRPVDQLIRQANEAFQNYLRFLGEKKYAGPWSSSKRRCGIWQRGPAGRSRRDSV